MSNMIRMETDLFGQSCSAGLCTREREYYQRNKERLRELARNFYYRNKEKCKERSRKYHQRNKETTKERANKRAKEYYHRNKEKRKEYLKKWHSRNPIYDTERAKDRRFEKYGLTKEEYQKLLVRQRNKCAICLRMLTDIKTCIDHCHNAGHVRGILCSRCNWTLGMWQNSVRTAKRAVAYLQREELFNEYPP